MRTTNVATRLVLLLDEAQQYGAANMTAPAIEVWSAALVARNSAPEDVLGVLAAVHHNINRVQDQLRLVDPDLLRESADDLSILVDALSMRRLEEPWNNTRRLLSDRVRLTLRACAAALDGRYDEPRLAEAQIGYADSLLASFIDQIDQEALPDRVKLFLTQSVEQLRIALRRMRTLGPDEFCKASDHLVANIGRALVSNESADPTLRRVLKRLGITVASMSMAVTMGLGIIDLDQKTVNLLPWGDQVDETIVKCIIDVPEQPRDDLPRLSPQTRREQ